jgi:CRISPR/Cas system CSM-associated protein Csm2 small subunit
MELRSIRLFFRLKDEKFKEIAELVMAIDEGNYEKLIQFIRNIVSSNKIRFAYDLVSNMEQAFNYSKLITDNWLIKRKAEDIQFDLITLKRTLLKEIMNDKESDKSAYSIIQEILRKLENSRRTGEILKAFGTNENDLMKDFTTEIKGDRVRRIWSPSS